MDETVCKQMWWWGERIDERLNQLSVQDGAALVQKVNAAFDAITTPDLAMDNEVCVTLTPTEQQALGIEPLPA